MASSIVSSMLLVLVLVLVFPHIDEVLGAQMEIRKIEETNHADQVTAQKAGIRLGWISKYFNKIPKVCEKYKDACKVPDCPKEVPKCNPSPPNIPPSIANSPFYKFCVKNQAKCKFCLDNPANANCKKIFRSLHRP